MMILPGLVIFCSVNGLIDWDTKPGSQMVNHRLPPVLVLTALEVLASPGQGGSSRMRRPAADFLP
jgi:hypothetical protein